MHLCVTALLALPSVCPNQKGAEQSGGNIRNVKIISWCPEVPSKELRFFFFWQAPLSTSHHSFQINSACVCVMCWCGRALTPVHRRYFEVSNRPPCMPPPTFSGRLGSEHRTHSSHAEAGGGKAKLQSLLWWAGWWSELMWEREPESYGRKVKNGKAKKKSGRTITTESEGTKGRREEGFQGEQKERSPIVWEQGQRRSACQSGLNHQGETPQVEEVIRGSHTTSRTPSVLNKDGWDESWCSTQ